MECELKDQIAIVTGGARGMGAAIGACLARAGSRVVLTDIDADTVKRTASQINDALGNESAVAIAADVTNERQVEALIEETGHRLGAVTTLVNNAGLLFPTPVADISLGEWEKVLSVNLTGTFLCSRAAVPVMREQRFGRIVNMSSSAGRSVSTIGGAHYTAAKAGVLGLTRALAKELAADGILVNAVCPGLIDTQMVREICDEKAVTAYEGSFPLRRLGLPDEVASVVRFLCNPESYITGASIDVNGGDLMI